MKTHTFALTDYQIITILRALELSIESHQVLINNWYESDNPTYTELERLNQIVQDDRKLIARLSLILTI